MPLNNYIPLDQIFVFHMISIFFLKCFITIFIFVYIFLWVPCILLPYYLYRRKETFAEDRQERGLLTRFKHKMKMETCRFLGDTIRGWQKLMTCHGTGHLVRNLHYIH